MTRAHWEALAQACDVRQRFLRGLVDEMATRVREILVPVREAFEKDTGDYPALQRIGQVLNEQIRREERHDASLCWDLDS